MTGCMTAAAEIIRVLRGQVPMRQGKSPHIADLRRNLPRRLPLAFVSLTVGPPPARTTGIAVEKTRRMQITVQRMRPWLPRAAHHIAGPIHFFAQLFQHIRGLSPTSQFSASGGAVGGNMPTRGAEMPTRPSKALALAPLARCRWVSWLVRAIAGVASEAAAISAADRSLSLVI